MLLELHLDLCNQLQEAVVAFSHREQLSLSSNRCKCQLLQVEEASSAVVAAVLPLLDLQEVVEEASSVALLGQ